MPNVPVIQDSANLEIGTGRRRIQGDPNAFGAEQARATAQLGESVARAGQVADEINTRFDEANARELDNAYQDAERQALYDPDTGYLNLSGRNALEARPALQQNLDNQITVISRNARSPRALQAFQRIAAQRRQNALERADAHAGQQMRVYENDTSQARIDGARRSAGAAWNDDAEISRQLGVIDQESTIIARRNGASETVAREYAAQQRQNLAQNVIAMRVENDPSGTLALLRGGNGGASVEELGPQLAGLFHATQTSGRRTAEHNAEVGGVANSLHLQGHAVDLSVPADYRGMSKEQIEADARQRLAQQMPGVNFSEVIFEGDHLHVGWEGGDRPATGLYADLTPTARVTLINRAEAELERRTTQVRTNLREQMDIQTDQMETGVPVASPIPVETVRQAFGDNAANVWELRLRTTEQVQQMSGQPTAQLAAVVAEPPRHDNVVEAGLQQVRQRAAAQIIQARQEDPRAFDVSQGLISNSPSVLDAINTGNWLNLGNLLTQRTALAGERQRLGLRPAPLTVQEAGQLRQQLDRLPAQQRAGAISSLQASVRDPRAYRELTRQLYADAPGAQLGMAVQGRRANIAGAPEVTGDVAARWLMEGAAALGAVQQQNSSGEQGADRPRRTLAMPNDGQLRQVWVEETGTAYRGSVNDEPTDFEAFRAAYAGASIEAGDNSGQINMRRARIAARVATGGVTSDKTTVLPWGVSEHDFRAGIQNGWRNIQQHFGGDALEHHNANDFQYMAVGDRYAVMYGGAQVRDRNGQPVYIGFPGQR